MGIILKRAAAFCWNSKGECFGVLMTREGQNFKVLYQWKDKSTNQDAISSTFLKGFKQLKVKENDFVVAGEMGLRCSFVDIKQPLMNPKDMKKALNFTLSSHFPIDPVDLSWSYRVVSDKDETGLAHVRLMAMKNKNWNDWVDRIGSLKLDTIVSPAAVVDSVVNKPAYISVEDDKGFIVFINGDGKLHTKPANEDEIGDGIFGAGDDPLDFENLDTGNMKEGDKSRYAQAVMLGMYALTENLKKDKITNFEIPQSMQPKRNAILKNFCGACLIFLILLGIFQASRVIAFKKKEAAQIETKIKALEKEAYRSRIDQKKLEAMQMLQEETDTKVETWSSARDALAIITDKLPKNFYMTSYQFRTDNITCKVMQVEDDPAAENTLYKIFTKVPYFDTDVRVQKGSKDITLSLSVRKPEEPVEEEEK